MQYMAGACAYAWHAAAWHAAAAALLCCKALPVSSAVQQKHIVQPCMACLHQTHATCDSSAGKRSPWLLLPSVGLASPAVAASTSQLPAKAPTNIPFDIDGPTLDPSIVDQVVGAAIDAIKVCSPGLLRELRLGGSFVCLRLTCGVYAWEASTRSR